MNTLLEILGLYKRKKFATRVSPKDVLILGVHEEPDMTGVASPVPYKDTKLIRIEDLSIINIPCQHLNVPIDSDLPGVFKDITYDPETEECSSINFKRLKSLSLNLSIEENGDFIEFNTTAEPNSARNEGVGIGVYSYKDGETLVFRSIDTGDGLAVIEQDDTIKITSTVYKRGDGICSIVPVDQDSVSQCFYSTVNGGFSNSATENGAVIGGGYCNTASGNASSIVGGCDNLVNSCRGFIGGGESNIASGFGSIVVGGYNNSATGDVTFIGSGCENVASSRCSSILGGINNSTLLFENSHIIGSNICATRINATFVNGLNIVDVPTPSTSGADFLVRESTGGEVRTVSGSNINKGFFAQTADGVEVTATTTETSLVGDGEGTLSVPANAFAVGDSYNARMGGRISTAGGSETIRIRVESFNGVSTVALADSGVQTLPSLANEVFDLEMNFTIRTIGGSGVASIYTMGSMMLQKSSSGSIEGFEFNTLENTNFDTTDLNTLDVTVEWGKANSDNKIQSRFFTLNKIF